MQNRRLAQRTNRIWPTVALTAALSAQGGCFLIPTADATACTCDMGEVCNAAGVCQPDPEIMPPDVDMKPECIYNDECDSGVCEYDSANVMANRCLSSSKVVYVDPTNCSAPQSDGTRARPLCSLTSAINKITSSASDQVIRLVADVNYGNLSSTGFTGHSIAIYGPHAPRAGYSPTLSNVNLQGAPAVSLQGSNTKLVLDGLVFSRVDNLAYAAIECSANAQLILRRSAIINSNTWGLHARDCASVAIERTQFISNRGAIFVDNLSDFSVVNSVISSHFARSDYSTIFVRNSHGRFYHNTLFGNSSIGAGAFQVESLPGKLPIVNSIVLNNSLSFESAQFFPAAFDIFSWSNVVIGKDSKQMTYPAGIGLIALDANFTNISKQDFRLFDDSSGLNNLCCIKKANKVPGITIDLYGNHRADQTEVGAVGLEASTNH